MTAIDRDPSVLDEALAMRTLEAELLAALGPAHEPSVRERLTTRVLHALRCCHPDPLCVLDPSSGRLVPVGWLCAACGRETALDEPGGHR